MCGRLQTLRTVQKLFKPRRQKIERKTCPFADYDEKVAGVTWITPKFVGEVRFTEWTSSGKLRHPRFLGLRKDKPEEEVVREDQRNA